MKTITLDILDDQALGLLKNLEGLNVIRLHKNIDSVTSSDAIKKLKGSMTKQSVDEIEKQLRDLRAEWD